MGNSSVSDAEDYRGYESCLQFRDPADHEVGTQMCRQGYDFQFEGENEMTITAEVSLSFDLLLNP